MSGVLNDSQKQAINTYDNHLLIVAGAGTGKTSTITMRIANLIQNSIAPASNILAVTFTNKAANEMKTRIEKLVGDDVRGMWVGTFHSISARIIRMYSKALELEPDFLILDDYDRKKLITGVIRDLEIDEKRFPLKVCSFIISQLKEKCVSPQDEEKISTFKYKDLDIVRLYQTYQSRLRGMNAVDFDDLIFECVRLFKKEPQILYDLQNRFQFITVDEYQDTNELQHLWLRLLAGSNNNICCVGDEDQSIYGWRGARVDYILNFADDFPGAKIVRLEQNYRSTQPILDCAMSVISNNKQRYNKILSSGIHSEKKPELILVEDDRQECKDVIKKIIQLNQNGTQYRDIAILVRATHQMKNIEDAFIQQGLPYKIIGGVKFYERKEIKDMMAYIRWCYSLKDVISLERIINVPKRGIGEKGFADILSYIDQNNWSIFDGLKNIANNFGNIVKDKIAVELRKFVDFTETIHKYFIGETKLSLIEIFEKIYFDSGYFQMLQDEIKIDPEIGSKIENIKELISSAEQFDKIEDFLEHISLVSATDDDNVNDSVNIMTMHAAKGLEFLYVFLPAWNEGIFPSQKSVEENGGSGIEEERRLAYVALTRARKNFFVYSAKQRMQFGRLQLFQPSMFVNEMGKTVEIVNLSNQTSNNNQYRVSRSKFDNDDNVRNYGYKSYYSNDNAKNAREQLKSGVFQRRQTFISDDEQRYTNKYSEAEKKAKSFAVGDRVISQKFGIGVIKRVYNNYYEVQFDGTKQITKDIQKLNDDS